MPTWIALFRGINVGGKNLLPMAKLKSDLESLGLRDVRTYIQSGNVVFAAPAKSSAALAKKIAACVEQEHGFRPAVVVLSAAELLAAVQANPFAQATVEPKSFHFFFLAEPAAKPNLSGLEKLKGASETYKLTDRVFYLHVPDGIGRSKLAAGAEKLLGVVATARNYRTVEKLLTMVTDEA